jgi:hypothetical protein
VTLCNVVVGYQCFTGPYCLHLEGEVTGMGKSGTDKRPGLERGGRCCLANRKWGKSDLAARSTSVRRECYSWLPLGTKGIIREPLGSPDLANREQSRVVMSSRGTDTTGCCS